MPHRKLWPDGSADGSQMGSWQHPGFWRRPKLRDCLWRECRRSLREQPTSDAWKPASLHQGHHTSKCCFKTRCCKTSTFSQFFENELTSWMRCPELLWVQNKNLHVSLFTSEWISYQLPGLRVPGLYRQSSGLRWTGNRMFSRRSEFYPLSPADAWAGALEPDLAQGQYAQNPVHPSVRW